MNNVRHFKYESATLKFNHWGEQVATISGLFSKERNKGHASKLMKIVLAHADANHLTVTLRVHRYGHPIGPDNAYLVEFYKKFGFEEVPGSGWPMMMRRRSQD